MMKMDLLIIVRGLIKMNYLIRRFTFVFLFLLVVFSSSASDPRDWTTPRWPWSDTNPFVGPSVLEWYPVEAWEVEVCREYGGTEESDTNQIVTTDTIYQLTLSLQGKRTILHNVSIYEISWYIHPFGGDKVNYSVNLFGSEGIINIVEGIEAGSAGSSGYVVHVDYAEFNKVIMDYDDGSFEVIVNGGAVVEEEIEGHELFDTEEEIEGHELFDTPGSCGVLTIYDGSEEVYRGQMLIGWYVDCVMAGDDGTSSVANLGTGFPCDASTSGKGLYCQLISYDDGSTSWGGSSNYPPDYGELEALITYP